MSDYDIGPGDRVLARTAFNDLVPRRAVTGPTMGEDFLVVRVCSEEEWEEATSQGRAPHSTPWPAEDVERADEPVDA